MASGCAGPYADPQSELRPRPRRRVVECSKRPAGRQQQPETISTDRKRPVVAFVETATPRLRQANIRQSAVRQGDCKYLRTYSKRDNSKFAAALYNLKDDIAEEKNLAESHSERMAALSNLLDQWEADMSKTAISFVDAQQE